MSLAAPIMLCFTGLQPGTASLTPASVVEAASAYALVLVQYHKSDGHRKVTLLPL